MIGSSVLRQLGSFQQQSVRNTWILRRVFAPEVTPPGMVQRDPAELPNTQKFEVVDFETKRAAGPLKVILLQDVEGIGHQFDVVSVDRKLARTDLLLTRKATYASPFDLQYYAEMKEKMKDELAARVRIPFEYVKVGRQLQKLVVPIKVSMDNPWTIDKTILKASLRLEGVYMLDDAVFISSINTISGPNFEIEANLIRFYVVVSKQYIVPMLGRITHISADQMRQVLSPESVRLPTAQDLSKFGLRFEEPYYHKEANIDQGFGVVEFMTQRASEQSNSP